MRICCKALIFFMLLTGFTFVFCQSVDISEEKLLENTTEETSRSRIKNIIDIMDLYVIIFLPMIATLFVAMVSMTIATSIKIANIKNRLDQIEKTHDRFGSEISRAYYTSMIADKNFPQALKWGMDVLIKEYNRKDNKKNDAVISDFVINIRNVMRELIKKPSSLLCADYYSDFKKSVKDTTFILEDLTKYKTLKAPIDEIFIKIDEINELVDKEIDKLKK